MRDECGLRAPDRERILRIRETIERHSLDCSHELSRGGGAMTRLRVVHYLNQFFAGIGGEDQAGERPQLRDSSVGPGQALQ